jgi:hypothetical protein
MNDRTLNSWMELSDEAKLELFIQTSDITGLPAGAIEKDWWVTHALSIIFSMSCAHALVFKGGTSLSKAWNLLERFSEDIDLALDREYLGFAGELSKKKIHKLRYASYDFLTTKFIQELRERFNSLEFTDVIIKCRETVNHDQDPLVIEIYYPNLTEKGIYLRPGILVEVGSRSLKEPYTQRVFKTMVSEMFADKPFVDSSITIPTVNPERTFLEKVFLLHEEFQRPAPKMRVERLSRHLYDIEVLSRTPFLPKALTDKSLYATIVAHRSKYSRLEGVDYAKHIPPYIKIVPPENLLPVWEKDYNEMVENMIYGEKMPFNELILKIVDIQNEINHA